MPTAREKKYFCLETEMYFVMLTVKTIAVKMSRSGIDARINRYSLWPKRECEIILIMTQTAGSQVVGKIKRLDSIVRQKIPAETIAMADR